MDNVQVLRKQEAVLCFIVHEDSLLLIHKLRGLGKGKINAPGGKLEAGESPLEAAIRETREETGLIPLEPQFRGTLDFFFTDGLELFVSVFLSFSHTGIMEASDEALPFWCPKTDIPWESLWEDDKIWLPHVLKDELVKGSFLFEGDSMRECHISFKPLA